MATYNGEKYLKEQLESFLVQTVQPFELVVCDDGSTDRTWQILRQFSSVAPFPVRLYVNDSNIGYADNFLKVGRACQGDWVAFSDQDDVWLPRKLECVTEAILRYPGDELLLVGHTSLIADEKLQQSGQRLPSYTRDDYIRRGANFGFFCVVGFSMICRTWLLKDIDSDLRPKIYRQNPSKPPGHDQWIGLLANVLGDIAYVSEPLAIWRRHSASLTRPPASEHFLEKARIAFAADKPDPYILLGNMALETADSLQRISHALNSNKMALRLGEGSASFLRLSKNLHTRALLYQQRRVFEKVKIFFKMLLGNAYVGPSICSLGVRSMMKDAAFVMGAISRSR